MDHQVLIERIAALEARARRTNRLGLAACVVIGCLALLAMQRAGETSVPESITAQQFVLVDDNGRQLGRWGRDGDGVTLTLSAEMNNRVVRKGVVLIADDDGGQFWLRGGAKHGALGMNVRDRGAQLTLYSSCANAEHHDPVLSALVDIRAGVQEGSLEVKRVEALPGEDLHVENSRTSWKTPRQG